MAQVSSDTPRRTYHPIVESMLQTKNYSAYYDLNKVSSKERYNLIPIFDCNTPKEVIDITYRNLDSLFVNAEYLLNLFIGAVNKDSSKKKDSSSASYFLNPPKEEIINRQVSFSQLIEHSEDDSDDDTDFEAYKNHIFRRYDVKWSDIQQDRGKRINNSISKFLKQLTAFIEEKQHFSSEASVSLEVMQEQYGNLIYVIDKDRDITQVEIKQKEIDGRYPLTIEFIDGFWGEGKTKAFQQRNKVCSEFDTFYRMILCDGKRMPDRYFRIGVVLGMIVDVHQSRIPLECLTPQFIYHRSPISHYHFQNIANSLDEYMPITFEHYMGLSLWRLFLLYGPQNHKDDINMYIYLPRRPSKVGANKLPWPIRSYRTMERELYPTEEDLEIAFERAHDFFDQALDILPRWVPKPGKEFNSMIDKMVNKKENSEESDSDIEFIESKPGNMTCSSPVKRKKTTKKQNSKSI